MALKPDRKYGIGVDISYFSSSATAERGGVMVHDTAGSGAAMDDATALVKYPSSVSGTYPAGVLLNDIVDLDLTRQHINWHKDEVQLGGKVTLLRQGDVVTNVVATGLTISAGQAAYYNTTGAFTNVQPAGGTQVGRFLSTLDADGYAKIAVNIT